MGNDLTKLQTDDLSAAAAKAVGTQTASAPQPVTPPFAAGTSPVDLAALAAIGSITTLTTATNGADAKAATKQATALTTSPPALQQQDKQNANDMVIASAPVKTIRLPMKKAHLGPPAAGGITSV